MADAAKQSWAMKVLNVDSRTLSSKDGLERARQRSVELYKRKIQERREPEAKKVLEAFEVLKRLLKPSRPPSLGAEAAKRQAPAANGHEPKAAPPAKVAKIAGTADAGGMFAGTGGHSGGTSRALARGSSGLFCVCGRSVDVNDIGRSEPKLVDGRYFCPECRVRAMDPFKPLLEGARGLMKMALMRPPLIPAGARNVACFKFQLDVPNLKEWRKKGQQVEVRMCRLDTCEAVQAWPTSFTCRVNGAAVVEINAPKAGHKRRDVPKVISAELHSGTNVVEVRLQDEDVRRFVFALCRSEPKSPATLIKEVVALPSEKCRERIKELLFRSALESTGEEVQAEGSDRCSLFCPVTQARLEIPIRGYNCRHLQCFDLKAFVATNYRIAAFNKRWLCPVCSFKLRPPKDLFVDRQIVKILAETESDDLEIAFDAEGTWRVTAKYEEPSPLSSDEADACDKPPVAVTLEDDDDDDAVLTHEPQASPGPEMLASPVPQASPGPDALSSPAPQASPGPETLGSPAPEPQPNPVLEGPAEQRVHNQRPTSDKIVQAAHQASPVPDAEAVPEALQKTVGQDAIPAPDTAPSPGHVLCLATDSPLAGVSPAAQASPSPEADLALERRASPVRLSTPVTQVSPVVPMSPAAQESPAVQASPERQGSPVPQGSPELKTSPSARASPSGQQARPLFNNTAIKITGMVRQARPSPVASSAFRDSPAQKPSPAPTLSPPSLNLLPRAGEVQNALNFPQSERAADTGALPKVNLLPPSKLSAQAVSVFETRPASPAPATSPAIAGAKATRDKQDATFEQLPAGRMEKRSKKDKKEKDDRKEKKDKKKKRRRTEEEMELHRTQKAQNAHELAASMLAEARHTNGCPAALQAGLEAPTQIARSPIESVDLIDSSSEDNAGASVANVGNDEVAHPMRVAPAKAASPIVHAVPSFSIPAALASPISTGECTPSLSPDTAGQHASESDGGLAGEGDPLSGGWHITASPVVAASDSEDGHLSDGELGSFLQSALMPDA